jgi:hypothetical protein
MVGSSPQQGPGAVPEERLIAQEPPPGGSIVVLGGYGAVGRIVSELLGRWYPGRVVVAGRNGRLAQEVAGASGGALRARQVDVTRPDDLEQVLTGAAIVVMCIERANTAVARACLERGIHHVDISASTSVLAAIGELDGLARAHDATAVLSVGLAPGLTNLLARRCCELLTSADTVDITVMLPANGDHGADALRWTVEQLTAPDRSRVRPQRVRLPGHGRRTAHPFPIADQHTVSATLGVRATTRVCFDSAALTTAVFALRSVGFFSLVRRLGATAALTALLSRLRVGGDRFAVHVAASAPDGTRVAYAVTGREESRATAIVTAHVARLLDGGDVPAGVLQIDQVRDAATFIEELRRSGIGSFSTVAQ